MPTRLKIYNCLIFITMLFLFSGCVTIYNPATQRKETLLIDTESEVALGKDMDRQIQRKLKVLTDPQRQFRLQDIGYRVSTFSDRQDLIYYFRIVDDPDFNAFAIPGGFIYVNSGLIDNATDDELAGVLGHEIGHLAARHSVKRLQVNLGYQIVMGIAMGVSGQEAIGRATDIVFNVASLGYSRRDEFLADKLAVKYARNAGFNPYGMITFFEKLRQEAKNKGEGFRLVFLSSHPPLEERIKNVEKEIALNP
jgi:predicted Zn-dependent protease